MSDIPYSIRGTSSVTRYAGFGTNGAVLTSNGSGAAPTWRTTVVLGASLTNSSYQGANPRSVVLYDNVEYETVSCYDA